MIRIDHDYRPTLTLDLAKAKPLALDAYETPTLAELAPIIEGKPDVTRLSEISLRELGERFRMQKIVFSAASDIYEQMKATWKGSREYLLAQVIRLVEKYIESDKLRIEPPLFNQDTLRRRIIITLSMSSVAEHLKQAIHFENTEALVPIFDTERPIRATGDMLPWYTGKPCEHVNHSHINMCVFDSRWEASEAFELDRSPHVAAWAKNDHLGFEITYSFKGIIRKVSAGLSRSPRERENACAGSEGAGQSGTADQARVSIRVGTSGQRPGRLRHVGLGRFPPSQRYSRNFTAARSIGLTSVTCAGKAGADATGPFADWPLGTYKHEGVAHQVVAARSRRN